MMIIGRDFHTRYQQIAMLDEATGELTERPGACLPQAGPILRASVSCEGFMRRVGV